MADSLTEQVLRRLGINIPTAPEVSPEQQSLYREMATREQAKRPQWKRAISSGIEGAGNFLKGLGLSDPLTDTPQGWPEFGGMAIGVAGLPFGPKGIKGMFSRTEKVAESLPGSVHPNKLAAILKNRASQEEVQWRGIDKMLAEHGNKPVAKQEFVEHLEKNPLDVTVTEKYEPSDAIDRQQGYFDLEESTQYDNYQMPGAKNYRETLIQLPPKPDLPELQPETLNRLSRERFGRSWIELTPAEQNEGFPIFQQAARSPSPASQGVFQSHHWDDPNVLVHVRHNERDLRNTPDLTTKVERERGPAPQSNYIGTILGNGEPIASVYPRRTPGPGVVPEMRGEADALLHQIKQQLPPPDRGRMLENVQSDWHQRGAHSGYAGSVQGVNRLAEKELAQTRLDSTKVALQAKADEITGSKGVNPRYVLGSYTDLTSLQYKELSQLQVEYDNALDAVQRLATDPVPDAPFKDSWAELALKQQLLDVADRPDLDWLGIAPSSELRQRGEVISPEFQDVQLPNTLEKLLKPFGGKLEQVDLGAGARGTMPRYNFNPMMGRHGGFYTNAHDVGDLQAGIVDLLPGADRGQVLEQLMSQVPNPQSFIARLPPDLKKRIREQGFPLLTLLAMMNAQRSSAQPAQPAQEN